MRLAQLARKISKTPTEIVDFLATQNIQISDGYNTKLAAGQELLIMQKFAPEQIISISEEISLRQEEPTVFEEPLQEVPIVIEGDAPVEPSSAKGIDEVIEKTDSQGVIKAPKVELSGLKVLGKIELPEVIKKASKTDVPTDDREGENNLPNGLRKKTNNYQRQDIQRQRKNPIAVQREREAREVEEKRQALAHREKENRTQYYQSKVKAVPLSKSAKLFNEGEMEMSVTELEAKPKSLWGKFLKWLAT